MATFADTRWGPTVRNPELSLNNVRLRPQPSSPHDCARLTTPQEIFVLGKLDEMIKLVLTPNAKQVFHKHAAELTRVRTRPLQLPNPAYYRVTVSATSKHSSLF